MKKYKGNGIVWDAEKNRVLCKFEGGEFVTDDERTIDILENNGYESEETEEGTDLNKMKLADLKALCEENGIEFDAKAKKDDLIKLLEGAE